MNRLRSLRDVLHFSFTRVEFKEFGCENTKGKNKENEIVEGENPEGDNVKGEDVESEDVDEQALQVPAA